MTTAGEIMHAGAQWIPATETLDRAAQLMARLNVGALPISDKTERLCGILTDRDIVVGCVAKGHNPSKVTAGDMAKGTPRWIEASADVSEVLEEMQSHQIHAASGDQEQEARRHDQRGRPREAPLGGADHAAGRRWSTHAADRPPCGPPGPPGPGGPA